MNVLADSSALISFFSKDDTKHQKALALAENYPIQSLLISTHIFAETVTMLSQRQGKEKSIKIGNYLKKEFKFVLITQEIEDLAWEIFKKRKSKNVSFIDCTCFALYKQGVYDLAFTFDKDFKKNGIKILE